MDRDELIRTASREAASILVFTNPDTKGQIRSTSDLIAERILDAIEPLLRADERSRSPIIYERDLQPMADFRAKVDALCDELEKAGLEHPDPRQGAILLHKADAVQDVLDMMENEE